ncbi:metallophosphoesterase [Psychrosphaera sp. F3M07]|uniref:metallophosphoesterase family protein n=1 Tax=Psychrosphaera sp. F3M07 TaxID=2841560 RepID=UPI001C0A5475|nr:metallophosphoesterase [Psychrosphaera sp. F3M07]MBU2916703.1 metallophosphoesterase [Psychrosphaera sp. F3M07]
MMRAICQIYLLVMYSLLISSCRFDTSPWEYSVDCDTLNLDVNLNWLAKIENTNKEQPHFSIAVIGDPGLFPGDLELTIKKINQINKVDFILLLGDLTELGVKQEYEWTCKAISHSNKPILSVIGNHDALSYGREIWLNTIGPYDYSFTYKNTKFIAYNDNKYEFADVPDKEWLQKEAALETDEIRHHTIGMSHIEPWWDIDFTFTDELKAFGFDLMLHAHSHKFSYWYKPSVKLPHLINADTIDIKYSIVNFTPANISVEQCEPECIPATAVNWSDIP